MKDNSTTIERRKYILEEIARKSSITVNELVEKFGVSEVSIRKDLSQLEKKNQLIKVRGGAIAIKQYNNTADDISVNEKQQKNLEEKKRIGKAAVSLIKEDDTIILDSGSTTCEIAKNLNNFQNLTIITNALNVALLLNEYKRFSVIIPGGYLRHESQSLIGHMAEAVLKNLYCDKFFLGIDSFNIEKGVSTPNIEEANLNQLMISIAKQVIAVFDSSKFYKRGFARIAPITQIDTIITDAGIPEDIYKQLKDMGKEIIIA